MVEWVPPSNVLFSNHFFTFPKCSKTLVFFFRSVSSFYRVVCTMLPQKVVGTRLSFRFCLFLLFPSRTFLCASVSAFVHLFLFVSPRLFVSFCLFWYFFLSSRIFVSFRLPYPFSPSAFPFLYKFTTTHHSELSFSLELWIHFTTKFMNEFLANSFRPLKLSCSHQNEHVTFLFVNLIKYLCISY